MSLKIQEIKNKDIWEDFLMQCKEKTFLQSWNWAEFQKNLGNKIWRVGVFSDNELVGTALIIKIVAKRGTFLFVPHGPGVALANKGGSEIKHEILKTLLKELQNLAKKEKASFIRISPIWERTEQNLKIFKELGFKNAPIHMHPELTWELDITPSENDLLMSMRKTTRYLIRQAMKNQDIKIYQSNNLKDVGRFNKLYQETVKRHDFAPFSLNYLKNEFLAFSPDNQVLIFLGKHQNKVLSSAIVIYWQNIGFYHQGASVASKIPVSYLMQWKAILQAKEKGCKSYNFWGITEPTDNKKHPWAGLTMFKKGFGGNRVEYVKTQDYIVSSKYYLNFLVETIRKRKRHF